MANIRIYSGVRSPYSRMGMHVIQRSGLAVDVFPFLGPPEGVPFSNPTDNPLKLAYIMADAPRMAARLGLKMKMPKVMDPGYKPANLAQIGATKAGYGIDFACAIADARWGEGKDISEIDVLADCAELVGWGAEQARATINEAGKEDIQKIRDLISQDGVFGVPFAVVEGDSGPSKFWGHERMELLVEEATKS